MNVTVPSPHSSNTPTWHLWFAGIVRYGLAPLLLICIGFFTADFLLSGLYTWPRTSRTLMLTVTAIVFSYEFVFKEQRKVFSEGSPNQAVKALIYSCLIPYAIGFLSLMGLASLGS